MGVLGEMDYKAPMVVMVQLDRGGKMEQKALKENKE
jgi:hypothetical protein